MDDMIEAFAKVAESSARLTQPPASSCRIPMSHQ